MCNYLIITHFFLVQNIWEKSFFFDINVGILYNLERWHAAFKASFFSIIFCKRHCTLRLSIPKNIFCLCIWAQNYPEERKMHEKSWSFLQYRTKIFFSSLCMLHLCLQIPFLRYIAVFIVQLMNQFKPSPTKKVFLCNFT